MKPLRIVFSTLAMLSLTLSLLATPLARASVLTVDAPIVDVRPILKVASPICDVPRPARSAGLVAALRWDLEGRCRAGEVQEELSGYRVEYEWDGRRFTTDVRDKPSGTTLPLRLRIN